MKKYLLLALVLAAAQAQAASWTRIMDVGDMALFKENGSARAVEGSDVTRANFRVDYDFPKKLESGKHYQSVQMTLFTNCRTKRLLVGKRVFSINGAPVGQNSGQDNQWTSYNKSSERPEHILLAQSCYL